MYVCDCVVGFIYVSMHWSMVCNGYAYLRVTVIVYMYMLLFCVSCVIVACIVSLVF